MIGKVDSAGRALISVEVASDESAVQRLLDVWVDTGFTGDLVIPKTAIDDIGLGDCGTIEAVLADGTVVRLRKYGCWIDCFGERRFVEVIANEGDYPLLGIGLMVGHELTINYSTMAVDLE